MTGSNGFIGQFLLTALIKNGFYVRAVMRKKNDKADSSEVICQDISPDADWGSALKNIDIVIHLAARVHVLEDNDSGAFVEYLAVNVNGTANLALQAAAAGVKRFVFISSIGVNGNQTTDKPFNEKDDLYPHGFYAVSKWEAEKALHKIAQETGLEIVIVRPPLVYGAGVKANFKNLLKLVKSRVPLPFGAIDNLRSLIYVENLVDFLILCTHHPKAVNETFVIADGDDVSTTQLITSIAEQYGRKALLISFSKNWLEKRLKSIGKHALATRLLGNLQVDITKARTLLGWQPPFTFKQGIARTINPPMDDL